MAIWDEIRNTLAATSPGGYHAGSPPAIEPTALAAVALAGAGLTTAAHELAIWLAARQADTGTLGVTARDTAPHWPTGWGLIAWQAARQTPAEFQTNIDRAVQWLAATRGEPMHSVPELGHDPSLVGWPWVEGTHSWVEPTAIAALGLAAAGQRQHPRALEAVRLLYDRQLPTGGWNYGNTVVLGQELRPHVQPTGLALLALRQHADAKGHIAAAVRYLRNTLNPSTTTVSLCFALLGLAAQQQLPATASDDLAAAAQRTLDSDRSPYKLALLVLAAQALDGQLLAGVLAATEPTISRHALASGSRNNP